MENERLKIYNSFSIKIHHRHRRHHKMDSTAEYNLTVNRKYKKPKKSQKKFLISRFYLETSRNVHFPKIIFGYIAALRKQKKR